MVIITHPLAVVGAGGLAVVDGGDVPIVVKHLNDRLAAIASGIQAVEFEERVFAVGKTRIARDRHGSGLVAVADDFTCWNKLRHAGEGWAVAPITRGSNEWGDVACRALSNPALDQAGSSPPSFSFDHLVGPDEMLFNPLAAVGTRDPGLLPQRFSGGLSRQSESRRHRVSGEWASSLR